MANKAQAYLELADHAAHQSGQPEQTRSKSCKVAGQPHRRALAARRDRNQRLPPSRLDSPGRIHTERPRTAHRSGLTVLA